MRAYLFYSSENADYAEDLRAWLLAHQVAVVDSAEESDLVIVIGFAWGQAQAQTLTAWSGQKQIVGLVVEPVDFEEWLSELSGWVIVGVIGGVGKRVDFGVWPSAWVDVRGGVLPDDRFLNWLKGRSLESTPPESPDRMRESDLEETAHGSYGESADLEEASVEDTGTFVPAPQVIKPSQSAPPPAPPPSQADSPKRAQSSARRDPAYTHPQYSAFFPHELAPEKPYLLAVYVHIESAIRAVRDAAANYAAQMGGLPTGATANTRQPIPAQTRLTFVPRIAGLSFTPERQSVEWPTDANLDGYTERIFSFITPARLPDSFTGAMLVMDGPIIIGEIPVTMQTASGQSEATFQPFDPIFASYSHRDAPIMEYFRRTRAKLGQKMLVDIYDLRSGDHWQPRLLKMIDESAVFQLFWSQRSAESQYCRQEWLHALSHLPQRPRFVQPVFWETPTVSPDPPRELSDLHFERVEIPKMARFRALINRLRGN